MTLCNLSHYITLVVTSHESNTCSITELAWVDATYVCMRQRVRSWMDPNTGKVSLSRDITTKVLVRQLYYLDTKLSCNLLVRALRCVHPHLAMGSWLCRAPAIHQVLLHKVVRLTWTLDRWVGASKQTPSDTCNVGRFCAIRRDHSLGRPRIGVIKRKENGCVTFSYLRQEVHYLPRTPKNWTDMF